MIRTEAEYKRALDRLRRDAEVIEAQRKHLVDMGLASDEIERAMQPVLSFNEQLKEEVETYEQMRRGDLGVLHHLTAIGRWLIGIRIAKSMSQSELAELLGVSPAQVSRDETNEYHGITVERAQRILEVLGIRFKVEIEGSIDDSHNRELHHA